ncbi:MAG: flagellar hook-length control protein FliK [Lachnospiraceae bacterium]|nr:flagellar hook-length control protein FliK [Lachnospiraceae bacterium]
MGITPIKDATGIADQLLNTVSPGRQADNSGSGFRSVWMEQAGNGSDKSSSKIAANDTAGRDNVSSARTRKASGTDVRGKESPRKAAEDVDDSTETGGMLKDEEIESAQETLAAIASGLAEKLADILDMSPEEFQELLQAEGLSATDLLDRDTLSGLLLTALNADSQLSLLTNEADYAAFSEGLEALEEVLSSDAGTEGMDIRDLKAAVEEALQNRSDAAERSEDRSVTRFERNADGVLEQVGEGTDTAVNGQDAAVTSAKAGTGKDSEESGSGEMGGFAQTAASVQADAASEASQEAPVSYVTDARQIADQILDQMKTVTDGDFSDVEMQLHPASLGTLHVHVTNNAGVITANFVTENEAVKAAVESQIIRLNEQFEAQGIKVDAVEVTIASHSFEQNLESGQNDPGSENGRPARRTRRIDLGGDGELDTSSMEEDERIAAEMMAANGNKVDYTA